MNKITIRLIGGLGNYLFQIACAYSYSKKHNKELFLTEEDSLVIHKKLDTYKNNILNKVKFSKKDNTIWKTYTEAGFNYTEIPFLEGDVLLASYFQSEKYFKDYTDEIKNLFSYPAEYKNKVVDKYKYLLSQNTCSIHVRRGDYLASPNHHPVQNMNYYMKAIKQMPKDSIFLIFSDDIAWCKSNFPDLPEKFIFIEGNSDHEDLMLMSQCENSIICNSTFSWWGAWLNNNPDKKIISPIYSRWFGSAYANYDTTDIIPDGWIQI